MTDSAPSRAKALEEESETTPSGIQSDTPDWGESEAQSLPTRDYTSSATPTTTATVPTSTWGDDKKPFSSLDISSVDAVGQETPGTTRESVTAVVGSLTGAGALEVDDSMPVESATTATKSGTTTVPSELAEGAEGGALATPCGGEGEKKAAPSADKGVAGEGKAGMASRTVRTSTDGGGDVWKDEKAADPLYREELPIESMPGYLPWDKDSQMLSCYQERKDELCDMYKDYVTDHPELFSILADFLQAMFIQKPSDVYAFARDFFQPFAPNAPHLPSHPTTLQPDIATPTGSAAKARGGDNPSSQTLPDSDRQPVCLGQLAAREQGCQDVMRSPTSPGTASLRFPA